MAVSGSSRGTTICNAGYTISVRANGIMKSRIHNQPACGFSMQVAAQATPPTLDPEVTKSAVVFSPIYERAQTFASYQAVRLGLQG